MSIKDRENTKLTKEDIDKVRHIEGFPIGSDEDIIALSNPPYYTACPNPFIEDFINEYGKPYDEETDDYHREPFAADVSEGKNDPIYMAHTYHTKVPHKAIMSYILHYTNPGDIVFDGFSGTGMTGVAAQSCGTPDEEFKIKTDYKNRGYEWGNRNVILSDLSPAACFIANHYNSHLDIKDFTRKVNDIVERCENELGWMYKTNHVVSDNSQVNLLNDSAIKGTINYIVWSDVFICPNCTKDFVFWSNAVSKDKKSVKKSFNCPHCNFELKKENCTRDKVYKIDTELNKTIEISKQVPVLINYSYKGKRYEKDPDKHDLKLIEDIEKLRIPYWVPTTELPDGDKTNDPRNVGITNAHHYYTKRNLYILARLWEEGKKDEEIRIIFTSILQRASKLFKWSKNQAGPMMGTLFFASLSYEQSIFKLMKTKIKSMGFSRSYANQSSFRISNNSSTDLSIIPENSIDYIFTDPPFGSNINYSELSFIWESWFNVLTNIKQEAIISKKQNKNLDSYQKMMTRSFSEFYRILKPSRWITIEFHNSKNAVWNVIQESIIKAGFIIADVRVLDKHQGSFNQVKGSTQAIKQDLVISAYKPKESFRKGMLSHAGSEITVWEFVNQHLEKLPIIVRFNNSIEILNERQAFLLFDRMVAYHIMQGIPIPIDAADFYKKLDEKFPKRDGMYFLQDQVNEYDQARLKMDVDRMQMEMFVSDEKSAIAWLYKELETPQTYSDIQPKFMKEARSIEKHELLPELAVLLEDNFLKDEEGRWYIPDTKKIGDVMKLREKRLLKEFDEYLNSKGKLKKFRTEAVRAGFAKLWKEKNYTLIVKIADRLPDKVIQEDDKLLMYYDISSSRVE